MASSDNEEHEFQNNEETEVGAEEEDEVEQNDEEEGEEEEETEQNEEEVVENNEEEQEHEVEEENAESENEKNIDNDSEEEFAGFGEEEIKVTTKTKKRQILSDESDEEKEESGNDVQGEEEKEIKKKSKKKKIKKDDEENEIAEDDDEEQEEQKTSNAEEEEEEDEDIQPAQAMKRQSTHDEQEEDEEEVDDDEPVKIKKPEQESDLEKMLKKNQAAKKRRRKKDDSEEITDMDNKISMIIAEMKNVAAEDRAANEKSLTTLQKLKMLPHVLNMLQKSDHHATMIELGVLGAIAEWLAPLPDRSLPNIKIREMLIDALRDFGEINVDYLKSSGVGKAVMFLYKHSKETKANKQKLEKLINNWARPIFNLDSNFKQLTKEERLQRDMEHVRSLSKKSSTESNQSQSVDDILNATDKFKSKKHRNKDDADKASGGDETSKFLRPGDPGFCPRARVPIPSSKDYVIRPKSSVEEKEMSSKKIKKTETRLDKHKKRFIEIKRNAKSNRAVTMVAAGGK